MSIHIGGNGWYKGASATIKKLYVGSTSVKSIYVGNNLVWLASFPHDAMIATTAENLDWGGSRLCTGGIPDLSGKGKHGLNAYSTINFTEDADMGRCFSTAYDNWGAKGCLYWGPFSSELGTEYSAATPGNPIDYTGVSACTVHLRFKVTRSQNNPCLFDFRDTGNTMGFFVRINSDARTLNLGTINGTNSKTYTTTNTVIPLDSVINFTVAVNNSNNTAKFYLNGVLKETITLQSGYLKFGNSKLTTVLNFYDFPTGRYSTLRLRNFRLYGRELTASEVSLLNQYPDMY